MTEIELFLVAAVVGVRRVVRRVRSVRSDRTPQTTRTVRLFGGLKTDLRGVGLALQQAHALKGSQMP